MSHPHGSWSQLRRKEEGREGGMEGQREGINTKV
jgi:hypothetical protein